MDHCGRREPRASAASSGPGTAPRRNRRPGQPGGPGPGPGAPDRRRAEVQRQPRWSGERPRTPGRGRAQRAHFRQAGRALLDRARNEHRYDQLVLVAPPKFLGALRKELHKEVEKLVTDELPKDLSWFNVREIEKYFAKGSGLGP